MAIKEILDILGENPTESVYSEGKDFVTKKIKLYIDKKRHTIGGQRFTPRRNSPTRDSWCISAAKHL